MALKNKRLETIVSDCIRKSVIDYNELLPLEDQLESIQLVSLVIAVEKELDFEVPALQARQIFSGSMKEIIDKLRIYAS